MLKLYLSIMNKIYAKLSFLTILLICSLTLKSQAGPDNWSPYGFAVNKGDYRILSVDPGSPADGILKPGDKLQGWFSRISVFGSTFDELEAAPNGGSRTFDLTDGRKVTLTLPHYPNWGPNTPIDCPKCQKMIDNAANYIISNNDNGREGTWLTHLALLSTGEPAHLAHVRNFIHNAKFAKPDYADLKEKETYTWLTAYSTILLAEYYLITNDAYVLPAIRNHALAIAYGASGGGNWNHQLAPYGKYLENPNLKRIKRQTGYIHQNSASLKCYIALLLAEKCGVQDPIVLDTLKKNLAYYRSLVGEKTIPYSMFHDSENSLYAKNGTAAMASIALSLAGDIEAAKYFLPHSIYNYSEMYYDGHTGSFFGRLWIGLGANLAGHPASKYVFNKTKWLVNASRKSNGSFSYEDPNRLTYRGLSPTGAHLINLCRDRRNLYITGKNSSPLLRWDQAAFDEKVLAPSPFSITNDIEFVLAASKSLKTYDRRVSLTRGNNTIRFGQRFFADNNNFNEMINRITNGNIWIKETAFDFFQLWASESATKSNLSSAQQNTLFSLMRTILNDNTRSIHDRNSAALVLIENTPSDNDLINIINFFITKQPDDYGFEKVRLVIAMKEISKITQQSNSIFNSRPDLLVTFTNTLLKHPNHEARKLGFTMLQQIPNNKIHLTSAAINEVALDKSQEYHTYHNSHRATVSLGDNSALFNHLADQGITFSDDPPAGTLSFDDAVWQSLIQNGSTSYDDWKAARFVDPTHTIAQKSSDPDNDGQSNFIEYALGSNPHKLTPSPLSIASMNNNQIELTFQRPMGSSDASITPQSSTKITNWQSQVATATPHPNGIKQTIRWSVPQSQAEFFRLLIKPKQ